MLLYQLSKDKIMKKKIFDGSCEERSVKKETEKLLLIVLL